MGKASAGNPKGRESHLSPRDGKLILAIYGA